PRPARLVGRGPPCRGQNSGMPARLSQRHFSRVDPQLGLHLPEIASKGARRRRGGDGDSAVLYCELPRTRNIRRQARRHYSPGNKRKLWIPNKRSISSWFTTMWTRPTAWSACCATPTIA